MNHDPDTAAVRPGEELPVAALQAYLADHLPEVSGPLTVEQFPHGHSNLTYLVRFGDREFVLRRPPFGNQVKTAHDMGREYRVLSKLWSVYPPAPRPYLHCEDDRVLGAPFYVMERRSGIVLRRADYPGLTLDPPTARRLSTALIDNLALLHALDYKAAGLADLGKPDGYVARQVSGWINRYANAQTEALPDMDRFARWLTDHQPAESGAALIHNDFKYDNLVLDREDLTHVVAVLDWEMATVGDPLMDLGTALGYWVESGDPESARAGAFGPTALPGSLTRHELVARYADKTGRDVSGMLFYYCFGVYKIAVIIQQIYARYARGHTRDARFARLNERVAALCQIARLAAETGRF
ncbi:MAG TPA: phosphotransferase family protein [Gemmataceae bacterium]|nr:phosphotransferase family protein [Gemmataceae bacterium]